MSAVSPPASVGSGSGHRLLAAFYWIVLLLSIVDHGAANPASVSILCTAVFVLLPCVAILRGVPSHARTVFTVALLLSLMLLAVVVFQTTGLPGGSLAHSTWLEAAKFAPDAVPVISLTPADDIGGFLAAALSVGIFLTGLILFDTDERALSALRVMGMAGGVVSLWSIVQFLLLPDTLGFGEKQFYLDSLTGFFVNRNTAATFFGLIMLLLFALAWRGFAAAEPRRIWMAVEQRRPIAADRKKQAAKAAILAFLLAAAFVALMLTKSRAGIASGFAGMMLLGTLMAVGLADGGKAGFGRREGRRGVRFFRAILWALLVTAAFLVFAGQALLRAEVRGTQDDRFCVMPAVIAAIRDHFPWGSGLSSFQHVYAGYHDTACGFGPVFVRAHSVYAEGLLTLGVAFVAIAAIAILCLAVVFVRGVRNRRSLGFAGGLGLAALVLVLIHSSLDFSLQIPGMAASFAALLAPVVTICVRPPGRRRSRHRPVTTAESDVYAAYSTSRETWP